VEVYESVGKFVFINYIGRLWAQNVYDDWGPPNLDRVEFSGGAEDPALYISRLLGPSGRLKYLLWFLILKVLRDIRVFRLKE